MVKWNLKKKTTSIYAQLRLLMDILMLVLRQRYYSPVSTVAQLPSSQRLPCQGQALVTTPAEPDGSANVDWLLQGFEVGGSDPE